MIRLLFLCVNYNSAAVTKQLCESLELPALVEVTLGIADNSATRDIDAPTLDIADGIRVIHAHYPFNPGYIGAARLLLSELVASDGAIDVDAVVLMNTDLKFSIGEVANYVARNTERYGHTRWVLAPTIWENGRRYNANPNIVSRPSTKEALLRHLLRNGPLIAGVYHRLHEGRRRLFENRSDSADGEIRTIYAPHGAFIIFGRDFFLAGGSFPEAPLYDEEIGIAEIANLLNIDVLYDPSLIIEHHREATTSLLGRRGRIERLRASGRFYRAWRPEYAQGSMTAWFRQPGNSTRDL